MAIAFVKATAGATDATGAWTYTVDAPAAAGNLIIVQVLQDAVSATSAITITSATNVENLGGTDNVFTVLSAAGSNVGNVAAGYQYIFFGRSLNTSAIVITGGNSTTDDIYVRAYEFSGVSAGTTLATVIENSTAGSFVNGAATNTSCLDTGVTTLGPNRVACNFVALTDDAMGLAAFAGMTGGTWALPVSIYEVSTGTDGTLGLNTATIASAGTINGGSDAISSIAWGVIGFALIPAATAAVTGTITPSATEAEIVTGGKTIIITLTDENWLPAGTGPIGSTANTQAIIDNIDSGGSEGTGWDAVVKVGIETADVVRTSNTVATITLDAEATYNITANETITVTVPGQSVINTLNIPATPTFSITATITAFLKDMIGCGIVPWAR